MRRLGCHHDRRGSVGFKAFLLGPDLIRCFVSMALAQPRCVILRRELGERGAEFLDGFEVPHPQELLLEGPYRPLGDAIAFRLPDECRRTDHAETFDLILEILRHVV